ncbi:glutathione S-transferase [Mycobacterium sp. djl-10]|nr:glutathione S-transferase [Mycobacterium sp. djl-10]
MTTSSGELVHLLGADDWAAASSGAEYRPPSLAEVGFVHLSTPEQVYLPANRLFGGRTDLVLLYLSEDRLAAPLRWEPGVADDPDGMLFPHLYGPIPIAAVRSITAYRPGQDGLFGPAGPPST